MSYMEHKTHLLEALERCSWPVEERDVILLENEIKHGNHYVDQARKLLSETSLSRRDDSSDGHASDNCDNDRSPRSSRSLRDRQPSSSRSPAGSPRSPRDQSPKSARSEKSNHSGGSAEKFEVSGM